MKFNGSKRALGTSSDGLNVSNIRPTYYRTFLLYESKSLKCLPAFVALVESVTDKREIWEMLLLVALLCLTYLVVKGLDGYFTHKGKKLLFDAETERKRIDAQHHARALDCQARVIDDAVTLIEASLRT